MTRVALVFGGRSPEHEVSIVSARHIRKGLLEAGFEIELVGVDREGRWHVGEDAMTRLCSKDGGALDSRHAALAGLRRLLEGGVDVVFPIIHGISGEDGAIQGLCDFMGLPYVGGDMLCMSLTWDKIATRVLLKANGLPQPEFMPLHRGRFRESEALDRIEAIMRYPVFVKPSRTGSSIGIARVENRDDLRTALDQAFRFDTRVVVEQGLRAQELEIAALGGVEPLLSPIAEIRHGGPFYDFEQKYLKDETSFDIPAKINARQRQKLESFARRAWTLFNCYGLARIDFLVTDTEVYLNEINTLPGFTPASMYPTLMERAGFKLTETLVRLVDLALKRGENAPRQTTFRSNRDWFR